METDNNNNAGSGALLSITNYICPGCLLGVSEEVEKIDENILDCTLGLTFQGTTTCRHAHGVLVVNSMLNYQL